MTGAGSGGQGPPDGSDAEEAEKCPICLGVLAGGELAMPDSCCHVFCLRCLLTWAELQMCPSCPVDRRPFTNVYRWDGNLSLVQVPVRKQLSQAEVESCCCGNPEKQICVNRKSVRRSKRQKTERKADGKTKGLVRKCNDEDPSSLSRKKVRGAECCAWSPPPCVALTTSPVDIADPVWLAADMPCEPELKQCRPQVQHCPWLSPAAPIPADGTSRQRFHEPTWNNSPLPLELTSSPFPSSSSFIPSHFVFQGVVVCAVTRPKGGEKRGGRSTSKAPAKEQESLPSRRSGRNSKSQEEAPPSDATSPPQSSPSDSDSAASQSTKSGKTPQVPAKRKGKRVTNRKASGKRKAAVKKAPSPEVVSSPAASEEEDEGEGEDNGKKVEPEEEPQQEEQQHSDAEEEEQSRLNSGPGSVNSTEDDGDDAQEQSGDQQKRDDGGEESGDLAGPMDSPPDSPLSCSDGVESKSEEEPASPPPPGDEDEEEEEEKRPSLSPSDSWREDPASPPSPEQDDPNVTMETSTEPGDADDDQPSEEKTEDTSVEKPASPGAVESLEDQADLGANARRDADVKVPGSEEHSPAGSSDDGASKEDGVASKDDTAESRKDNGTDPFQDNTDVVPMDCSSPMSEPGDESPPERPSEGASRAAAEPAAAAAEPQVAGAAVTDQQERERSQERKNGKRRSRFHSPTRTWSPKKEGKKEASPSPRSRSRDRDGSGGPAPGRSSRARSRERDGDRDGDRDHSRRERSRERRRRHRSRSKSKSKSKSRSRSRSRSRTRSHRRGPSPERRGSRERSRERSPQRKERRGGWRSGGGSGFEGRRFQGGGGRFENGVPKESSPERQGWSDNPDWVTEKTRGKTESRNSDSGFGGASRWEDHKSSGNGGEPRGRGGRGGYEPSRGAAWGAASRSFYGQQDDAADSRWPRSNSGTGGNSGTDAYSRFNENRGGGRKKDSDPGDMLDRSGWSSASSWAVRRTLPADVQDYYSKRERGGAGSWNRQEEETQPADPAKGELPPQAVPGNAPVPVLNMIPPQPPQMNVLQHHFPMQAMQGALPVSLQPAAPYAMPPPVPLHLHPSVPLLQVPVVGAQGLPPPPPPPPPMQAGSQAAAQPDGQTTQMTNTVMGLGKPSFLPTPTKAGVAAASQSQAASSQALPSSTTQPGQHHRAQADSSKKEKKVQIQELAVNEVKTAIKPYYQKKEITKEEYKEIVRKAVEKVCHSKSGEVNSSKVANLVKAYVDKYKHARKK